MGRPGKKPPIPSDASRELSESIARARGNLHWKVARDVATTVNNTLTYLEHGAVGSKDQWDRRLKDLDGAISDLQEIRARLTT